MRISDLTAWHVRIPLKTTVRHASHTRRETDSIIVRCRLVDGTLGWGEGVPREYVTGETVASVLAQLDATDLSAQLGGKLGELDGVIKTCLDLELAALPAGPPLPRDCFGNAARCAVELAVLDAATRRAGVPLSAVTSRMPQTEEIRKSSDRARYSLAFTPTSRWKIRLRGWLLRLFGFHQAKVKVGVEGVDDGELLALVRRTVGPRVDLRLDANEAWECDSVVEKMAPLIGFGVTSLEQPVAHHCVSGLSAVRKELAVPIMLDESLCSLSDARIAIEEQTCDLFNIRLSKCGGFLNSLRIAALAHQVGLGYQLGCQVGETGVLSAAGRHFATSIDGIRYLEGSFDRFLVRERLTMEDLTFGRGGYAPALTAAGLGVTVDRSALARVEVARRDWTISSQVPT
ncbi:MAG: dipeptide epimerase [Planctomycetaceae bacterium]|jgi:muconate cycloisomerase|nr:dipeptide epimerase [Planctomycetaceae bacterium]MDP7277337.1 enolase C-terminal domain-like protein [Planctomycetaceae bacterium]